MNIRGLKESIDDEEHARCPHCGMPQGNIDEYDDEGTIFNCEDCGKPFELISVEEVRTMYFSTREYLEELTEEEELARQEAEERKPCKGQIDIFGKTVGIDSELYKYPKDYK